ncbi:MAG: hypothetical protein NC393_14665, partial [Clostridium sp.]|nr:hypothetical protein [Clostridium sp.]MCM1209924.1 hypothetical protein [Ruminococcus sp.]
TEPGQLCLFNSYSKFTLSQADFILKNLLKNGILLEKIIKDYEVLTIKNNIGGGLLFYGKLFSA